MFVKSMIYLFIVALILDSVGFKNFIWFMSVGYGFAVCGIGAALLLINIKHLTVATVALCIGMMIYGWRLGYYLYRRETRNANYRKTLASATSGKPIPVFVKVAMWITMCVLYVAQTSPVTYRLANGATDNLFAYLGVLIMFAGIALEATADAQKSAAKKVNPKRFCDTGLYRIVRCPNYFGEITFWTGILISGIGAYQDAQFIVSLIGWILIVYIMVAGSRRLELRQNKNYGEDPEYQAYVKKVPLIIPFVPIYSLAKYEWLKG